MAQRRPFGRIFETLRCLTMMPLPPGFAPLALIRPMPLNAAQGGQLALVGIGIEAERRQVPMLVGLEMNRRVDPVAPALDRSSRHGHALFWPPGNVQRFGPG